MSGGIAAGLIVMLAIFLGGVTCGVIASVSLAIKREDKWLSLTGTPPDAAAGGTRVLTGAGSRDTGPPEDAK